METEDYDVIIIGAGISGLTCADTLLSKLPDLRVLVLESKERCGGRTKSTKIGSADVIIDEGGMWIGKLHTIMLSLCERFGVTLVDQHYVGADVLVTAKGKRYLSSADHLDYPSMSIVQRLDTYFSVIRKVEKLIKEIPAEEPWKHPRAKELDSYSLDAYFRRRVWTNQALEFLNDIAKTITGCEASQISCLFALWALKTGGGWQYVIGSKDGAQEWRMLGGAQQISEGLKKAIEAHPNAQVLFNQHVTEVEEIEGKQHIRVRGSNTVYTCRELVSSGNASVIIRDVRFKPALPADQIHFAQRTFRGSYGKAIVSFKMGFWRDQGLSGTCINSKPNSFIGSVLDYCLPEGHNFYALACFFSGNDGLHVADLTTEERREGVLRDIATLLNVDINFLKTQMIDYHDYLWHMDPVIQGCSGILFGPGHFIPFCPAKVFNKDLVNRRRIHFVGTDVASVFPGYMEGAASTGIDMGTRLAAKLSNVAV